MRRRQGKKITKYFSLIIRLYLKSSKELQITEKVQPNLTVQSALVTDHHIPEIIIVEISRKQPPDANIKKNLRTAHVN